METKNRKNRSSYKEYRLRALKLEVEWIINKKSRSLLGSFIIPLVSLTILGILKEVMAMQIIIIITCVIITLRLILPFSCFENTIKKVLREKIVRHTLQKEIAELVKKDQEKEKNAVESALRREHQWNAFKKFFLKWLPVFIILVAIILFLLNLVSSKISICIVLIGIALELIIKKVQK